jgi:N-methylhydantoinase B
MPSDAVDPISLEVIKNRLTGITEEMGAALMRTSFSSNIKERRDFSCAIFNHKGEMITQAAHIPVHLGAMPFAVSEVLKEMDMSPGDMVVLNDPYRGGTHLPDITLVMPVFFAGEQPDFFLVNRAHHADIGGMTAGSLPLSTEIFQEGLRIPPVKLVKKGELCGDILAILQANVRTPLERAGDIQAQIAANRMGEKRILEMLEEKGFEKVRFYCDALLRYGERLMQHVIQQIPDGDYAFADFLDDDGIDNRPIPIRCKISISEDRATIDFNGSSPQVAGSVNAVRAITISAVLYAFRLLGPEEMPNNSGCMRPLQVMTQAGSIVDAAYPGAVAGGNVETSQRIVDVLLGALAIALPEKIPAASSGTMNNLTIGGVNPDSGELFAYYETIGGGAGGGPFGDGLDGVQTHMTNTLNTPIEALEHAYPLRILRYLLRQDSGGSGLFQGGCGIIREVEFLASCQVNILSERRSISPFGLAGGENGMLGRNILMSDGEAKKIPSKCALKVNVGDKLTIETPGGGGWGEK